MSCSNQNNNDGGDELVKRKRHKPDDAVRRSKKLKPNDSLNNSFKTMLTLLDTKNDESNISMSSNNAQSTTARKKNAVQRKGYNNIGRKRAVKTNNSNGLLDIHGDNRMASNNETSSAKKDKRRCRSRKQKAPETRGKTQTKHPEHRGDSFRRKKKELTILQDDQPPKTLVWQCNGPNISVKTEEEIAHVLIKWPDNERGMLKDQPNWRIQQIRSQCGEISFLQACSLRRHYLKLLNPEKTMTQLGLGKDRAIRNAAGLFEKAVQRYLSRNKIKFLTEEAQKQQQLQAASHATPDFVLPRPVQLRKYYKKSEGGDTDEEQFTIQWIEVKMFYGASTIPQGPKSAVGNLMKAARKYTEAYGPGAMVFMYGCGEGLAQQLFDECGVVVLDSFPLNVQEVEKHQRSWCANNQGEIMM